MFQEIHNIRTVQSTDFNFPDWIEEDEWGLYIQMVLLRYMRGYLKKWNKTIRLWGLDKKSDTIPFKNLIPKWWTCLRTHKYLIDLFGYFENDIDVIFYKEDLQKYSKCETYDYNRLLFHRFFNLNETQLFFENEYFCLMEDEIFQFIEIHNDFDTDENVEILFKMIGIWLEAFIDETLSKEYDLISHDAQRNLVLNKIADFHNLIWWTFKLQEKHFQNQKISLLFVIVLLWHLNYIYILDLNCLDDIPQFDEKGRYKGEIENLHFDILITEKAHSLFEGLFEIKNLVLNAIFNEEYKSITILKQDGKPYMFEWKREILWGDERFIDVVNKYPHSKIETDPYNGKINKYTVTEKIKLNKNEQE